MTGSMQYIPAQNMTDHAVRKYHGDVATGYDAKREDSPKWAAEQRIIHDMLSDLQEGDWIVDVPVGTGRFIPFYEEKGFCWKGLDVSVDMLKQSDKKVTNPKKGTNIELPFVYRDRRRVICRDHPEIAKYRAWMAAGAPGNNPTNIQQGIQYSSGLKDKSCNAAVMCRLTRWLSPEDCQQAMRELQRIARERIIFTARIANHPHARPVDLFEAALDGWVVHRNEEAGEPDYRVIELRPA